MKNKKKNSLIGKKLVEQINFKAISIKEKDATVEGVFSTANVDRHGDIVKQKFDLKAFKDNPVVLNSHQHGDVTKIIGKVIKISVKDGVLQGKIKFAVDENPEAKIAFDLIIGGFLNAFSIGFMVLEFDEKTGDIVKSELLELSLVSVPANKETLIKTLEDAGEKDIDVDKLNNIYDKDTKKDTNNRSEDEDDTGDKEVPEKTETGGDDSEDEEEESEEESEDEKSKRIQDAINKKEFERWDETNEFIRYKMRDMAEFEQDSLSRVTIKNTMPKIEATVGVALGDEDAKKHIQMLFFAKEDGWNIDDTKKWLSRAQLAAFNKPVKDDKPAPALEDDGSIPLEDGKSADDISIEAIRGIKADKSELLNNGLIKISKAVHAIKEATVDELNVCNPKSKTLLNKAVKGLLDIKKDIK